MNYDFASMQKQVDEALRNPRYYTDFSDVDPNVLHQMSELLEFVRTKGSGAALREAVAQLFERYILTSAKEGNANMEVANARGGYIDLKERLKEMSNMISSVGSGGITEVFDTLDQLKVKYPSGIDGVFVVKNENNWYYYNKTLKSWALGGPFNKSSLGIADVTSGNLDLRSITLDFDVTETHIPEFKAKYITSSTGVAVDFGDTATSAYRSTDFVPIPIGTSTIEHNFTIPSVGPSGWAIYDQNKGYIAGAKTSVVLLPDNARFVRFTSYDTTLAHTKNKVRFISFQRELLKTIKDTSKTETLVFGVTNKYLDVINSNGTEVSFSDNKYAISNGNEIPYGTAVVSTTARYGGGIAGWVVKDSFGNVILKGQASKFAVPSNAKTISFTDYSAELTHDNLTVTYISQAAVNLNGLGNLQQNLRFVNNYYIDVTTGNYTAHSGNIYGSTDFITIPHGTESIVSNIDILNYGTAGYALYDINKKYLFGERANTIQLKVGAVYIRLTDYNANGTHYNKTITFKGAIKNDNPFANKKIGFLGDSITYGYDPIANNGSKMANPWPEQVGKMLGFEYYENKGVSSSVLSASFGRVDALTMSKYYVNLRDDLDFVFVMGGINDVWNNLPLGQFGDTVDTTIYGALDVLVKKLLARYPAHTGTKIIFSNYCNWDQVPHIRQDMAWNDFLKAIDDVCNKHGIPVCDMSKEVGISAYSDTDYYYWKQQNGYHDAHPKQVGADVIAKYVANWIRNHYS